MVSSFFGLALLSQAQIAGTEGYLDTLRWSFGLWTAETRYVMLIDASGDPQMRARWKDIRYAIEMVSASVPESATVDVITFEEGPVLVYSGKAKDINLSMFPEKPTGLYTDWGRALEFIGERYRDVSGAVIIFAVSACCIEGIDIPSPTSPYKKPSAWEELNESYRGKNQFYFVPVQIESATSTYIDTLKGLVGDGHVLAVPVTLSLLKLQIEDIQKEVIRGMILGVLPEELESGYLVLHYSIKGDKREQLFIENLYPHLGVKIESIDSIEGRFMGIKLSEEDKDALSGLVIPPRDTVQLTKPHQKGVYTLRWQYKLKPKGLWFFLNKEDTLILYGNVIFRGAKEIEGFGFEPVAKAPVGTVKVSATNWLTVGGSVALVIIIFLLVAWAKGRGTKKPKEED